MNMSKRKIRFKYRIRTNSYNYKYKQKTLYLDELPKDESGYFVNLDACLKLCFQWLFENGMENAVVIWYQVETYSGEGIEGLKGKEVE